MDHRVVEVGRPDVIRILAGPPAGALLLSRSAWDEVRFSAGPAWRVVASRRVGERQREMLVLGAGP